MTETQILYIILRFDHTVSLNIGFIDLSENSVCL